MSTENSALNVFVFISNLSFKLLKLVCFGELLTQLVVTMDNANLEQNNLHESSLPLRQEDESIKAKGAVDVDEAVEDPKDQSAFKHGYKKKGLVYGVDDRPPFQIAVICAFQVSGYHLGFFLLK